MKKAILIYIIINTFNVLTHAQIPAFTSDYYTKFKNITILKGLSDNNILDIAQDKYGYIWIATKNGLNRYDGYRFVIFKHDPTDSTSISDNYITSLTFDKNNSLWVGTKNGLNKYISENETFFHYPNHSSKKNGLSHSYVRKVYNSTIGKILWVETVDGVLNKINIETNTIEHFIHNKITSNYYDYHSIFEDNKGDIWVGGRFFGPYIFDTTLQNFKLLKADNTNPLKKRDNDIACIFQDTKERYWMSATDGFYQYYSEKDEFKKWLSTSTFDIIESKNNDLWLATGNGLYKFNPKTYAFTSFKHNQNDNNTINSNHLNCLLFDDNNNLWIGTDKGISILHAQENIFRHYRHIPENNKTLTSNRVSSFLQDANNNIWIGMMGGGINKWDRHTDNFTSYTHQFGNKKVSCLFEDSHNQIWIGLWSGRGFYKLNESRSKFTHYALNHNSLKSDWYNDFFEDHKSRLWVGFWGASGVHFFNRTTEKFEPYRINIIEAPFKKPLKIIEVDNESIWCHNTNNYLHNYNINTKKYEVFTTTDNSIVFPEWSENNRLKSINIKSFGEISCIIKSDFGETYFATNSGLIISKNGIFKDIENPLLKNIQAMGIQKTNIYLITDNYLIKYNIDNNSVEKILTITELTEFKEILINKIFIENNLIFIGSNKGLFVFNIKTNSFEFKTTKNKSINDIKKGNNNNFWLATESGLLLINNEYKILNFYNNKTSFKRGLISENIYTILPNQQPWGKPTRNEVTKTSPNRYKHRSIKPTGGNKNYCWIGTEKGFLKLNYNDSSFYAIPSLIDIPIYQIKKGNDSSLWLATEIGLVQYFTENDSIVKHYKRSNHQLSSHLTQFIYQDNSGYIWIGTTNNGLNRIDTNNYNITHYLNEPDKAESFWGNNVSCVYECIDSTLIFGGNGINIYDKKREQFSHITTANGLISDKILGVTQDDNGLLWISTPKGIMSLNLKTNNIKVFAENWGMLPHQFNKKLNKTISGEIFIPSENGFYIFNPNKIDSIKSSFKIEITGFKIFNKQVKTDFTKDKNIVLNYNENFFTFEFSDFNFLNTKNQYLYMLKGIDKDWVSSNNVNFASYTNISPGNYSFLVTTKQQLYLGYEPEKIIIKITPPFWKSIWFYIFELLIIMLIIILIYRQRTRRFKLREKHLQLEQKLLRSQMNPHFIFNALIAIQSFIFKNDPKEAGRYLSKFAKLMRLFLQNTRHEYIALNKELETLVYYMELQQLRFSNSFNFKINCIDDIDPELVQIPPMMAQPFIENAIEHGFNSLTYKGEIDINYSFIEDSILISIKDNGKGINKTLKESSNKKHKSLATIITRERLRMFNNKETTYTMQIVDLSELDKNLKGTEVLINIPYKTK